MGFGTEAREAAPDLWDAFRSEELKEAWTDPRISAKGELWSWAILSTLDSSCRERPVMRMPQIAIRTIIVSGSVAICSLALLTWFVRAVVHGREEALSAQCVCNLKQLGLALLNYESTYGTLPPAYVADPHGRPLYSWRVV